MKKLTYIRPPEDLSEQIRGIYGRVARRLGVDSLYVVQVARGERCSSLVEEALTRELVRIRDGQRPRGLTRHEVQIFSDDSVLFERLVPFVAAPLKNGSPAITITTGSHRDGLIRRLEAKGLDVGASIRAGSFVMLDAAGVLPMFMVHGKPDASRFSTFLGGLIKEITKPKKMEHRPLTIVGECVSVLLQEGNVDAAIQLEKLSNQSSVDCDVNLLCTYKMSSDYHKRNPAILKSICAEHSTVHSQWK
jgi:hypothetical protein